MDSPFSNQWHNCHNRLEEKNAPLAVLASHGWKVEPITIRVAGYTSQTPQQICAAILDTDRWSEFEGYSILPGIAYAQYAPRTPGLVGSRIAVHNRDGSSHVEEIVEWDEERKLVLKFCQFQFPLRHLATHFLETWSFQKSARGTEITRTMAMYPKGLIGRLFLMPISLLMKKAFEKNSRLYGS